MTLHPNAAMRALQRELVRLNEGRPELLMSCDDRRIAPEVAAAQLRQADAEIAELTDAIRLLGRHLAARESRRERAAA